MSLRNLLIAIFALALSGCANSPPKSVESACSILSEKRNWYKASRKVEKKYSLPIHVQLAIIRQESSFRHNAAPPKKTLLGIPLWWRISSAYGFAQAKDETWEWYMEKTGNWGADRDNYGDAVDFIGWYSSVSQRTLGISKWDAFSQYLAYHEGHTGYKNNTYKGKPWLVSVAKKVESYSSTYAAQLAGCRNKLKSSAWWWPF